MAGHRKRGRPAHPDILTPGEWHVARAARYGLTNRQIAERRGISIDAVKYHLANILLKLGMTRRQDLVRWPGMPATSHHVDQEDDMTHATGTTLSDLPHIPPGFTRLFPYIHAENARAYLAFLEHGLGGDIIDIHAAPNGMVRNAHVRFGDTTIMVCEGDSAQEGAAQEGWRAAIYLYVADAEAAMARAVAAGGEEISPVSFRPYGEQQGGVRDPCGNVWWLSQRLAPGGY